MGVNESPAIPFRYIKDYKVLLNRSLFYVGRTTLFALGPMPILVRLR